MASGAIKKSGFPLSHYEDVTISGTQFTAVAPYDGWAYITAACTYGNFANLYNQTKQINLYDNNYLPDSTKTMSVLVPCEKGDRVQFRVSDGTISVARFFY